MATLVSRLLRATFAVTLTLAVFANSVDAQATAPAGNQKPPFSLVLVLEKDTVNIGDQVQAKVTLTNKSDHIIGVWKVNSHDQGGFVYKVEVRDERGIAPPDTKFGRNLRGRSDPAYLTFETPITSDGGDIPLKAGASVTDNVSISRLHDLSRPGKYVVRVSRFDPETNKQVESNAAIVTMRDQPTK